jgi:hypothetical protein
MLAGCCVLLLLGLLVSLPMSAATTKVDPTCAAHGCDGSDPYATLCAGQPFDHAYLVLSAPIAFAGQAWGSIQLWYSPLCRTSWARAVASVPALLLSATLTLPGAPPYLRATWNGNQVLSPQAFTPVPRAQASGEILRAGQRAAGCVGQLPRGQHAC